MTEADFIDCPRIPDDVPGEYCPLAGKEKAFLFEDGSIRETGSWLIILNVEGEGEYGGGLPCHHAHTPHIHVYTRYDGKIIETRAWIIPRVVTGYTLEYGSRTTLTCLDCVLEGANKVTA